MRPHDWPERLNAMIEAARHRPFVWGEWDCAIFCASVVQMLTGVDHYAVMRGRYTTEAEADQLIRDEGAENYEAILWRMLGEPSPIKAARRGDIVLSLKFPRPVIGVCLGERSVFITPTGLVFMTTAGCEHAWKIG